MRELDYGKVGMRIRQVRKAKGWSQDALAKKCGISMSFLGHIERGTRIMSMETFVNICEALDAGADELLWGVAGASDVVLGMWKEQNSISGSSRNKNPACASIVQEIGMNGGVAEENTENTARGGKPDSYAMYVKIMKSVAEIMNEA